MHTFHIAKERKSVMNQIVSSVVDGIWPTMMMPLKDDLSLDLDGLERLMYWYKEQGAHGIFALCYSSEIRNMTFDERKTVMKFVVDHLPKGMGLVAAGHVADDIETQIEEFKVLRDLGAPALVMIGNRLAKQEEGEDVFLRNAMRILEEIPDINFGMYECPYPYKRLFHIETLSLLARTNRFLFMKETSCDLNIISAKVKASEGTPFKIYNANAATALDSWKNGCAGFSGIMCNFHTDLYVRMWDAFKEGDDNLAIPLQKALGMFSVYEMMQYPLCAKAYQKEALGIGGLSRYKDIKDMRYSYYVQLEQLRYFEDMLRSRIKEYDSQKARGENPGSLL